MQHLWPEDCDASLLLEIKQHQQRLGGLWAEIGVCSRHMRLADDGRASRPRAHGFNHTPSLQPVHTVLVRYSQRYGLPQTVGALRRP